MPGVILADDNKPNTIGPMKGIENASLIAVKPSLKKKYLDDLMSTLEKQIKDKSLLYDHIIISHPVFEAIHPFIDGNGRIGRFLLNLLLMKINQNLFYPLYMSEALAQDKEQYKERLLDVQLNNDYDSWNKWISYFIDAMIWTKDKMQYRSEKIISLWNETYNNKAISTPSRKYLHSLFFKYFKLNKKLTIKKMSLKFSKYSIQTIYKDWKSVTEVLNIKDTLDDGYYSFESLRKILRHK